MKRLFVILGLLLSATVVYAQSNGFAPNGNYTAAFTVTTASSTKTLPAGAMSVVYNTGTVNAYCALGNTSVTATTNNDVIYPGGFMGFTRGPNSTIACLTATSGTTLNISGGAGIAAGAAGGGSSSGSGGSVTQGTVPWVVSGNGTAGTAASGVLSIQGIASMTPVQVSQATAATLNATVVTADVCASNAKTNVPISFQTTTLTQQIAASGSNKIYLCSLSLIASSATVFSISGGTGSNCASNQLGILGVAGTATHGLSLAANGGLTLGNGTGTIAVTAASSEICLVQSGAGDISGNMTYVYAP